MILGLDLNVNLGWVLGNAVGPLRRGTFRCADTTDVGLYLQSSDRFFHAIMPKVTGIAVEQPFLGENYYPARKALAQLGHVYWWARQHGIASSQILEVPVSTGKHTLAGHGHATKEQMIEAAERLGYPGMDEHQADALGIWWCYVFGRAESNKRKPKNSKGVSILQPPATHQ